ncbi:hypothetical protein EVAR_42731_1 [Eumeta japonica]|uniref:Uncharacterized protein n=1 Tax=Eumeta variegata TaxID=151549 RepID=A0A4C1XGA2_EUMVA|nr:hypothetical protein EVAR_42731_1 [Eumeta japonica]
MKGGTQIEIETGTGSDEIEDQRQDRYHDAYMSTVDISDTYIIPHAISCYKNCVELDDDISPFDFHVFDLSSIERFDIEEENETS